MYANMKIYIHIHVYTVCRPYFLIFFVFLYKAFSRFQLPETPVHPGPPAMSGITHWSAGTRRGGLALVQVPQSDLYMSQLT